ncbi:MAG: hypothetical protein JRJ49_00370 [Deltaproteobacteria bacterium]|nr:hypothetical protein [Deltaproteobacteria bacterium]
MQLKAISITKNPPFFQNFSDKCSEGEVSCGFNKQSFEGRVEGEIPNLEAPIERMEIVQEQQDKYAVLDFIQFYYKNISDPTILYCDPAHSSFHGHNHYS